MRVAGASREGDWTVQRLGVLDWPAVLRDVSYRSGSLQPMKRFVLPKLMPYYALLPIGLLINWLMNSGSTVAHLVAFGLFAVGTGIVFRRPKGRGLRALLGAGRSTDSR